MRWLGHGISYRRTPSRCHRVAPHSTHRDFSDKRYLETKGAIEVHSLVDELALQERDHFLSHRVSLPIPTRTEGLTLGYYSPSSRNSCVCFSPPYSSAAPVARRRWSPGGPGAPRSGRRLQGLFGIGNIQLALTLAWWRAAARGCGCSRRPRPMVGIAEVGHLAHDAVAHLLPVLLDDDPLVALRS